MAEAPLSPNSWPVGRFVLELQFDPVGLQGSAGGPIRWFVTLVSPESGPITAMWVRPAAAGQLTAWAEKLPAVAEPALREALGRGASADYIVRALVEQALPPVPPQRSPAPGGR